MQQTRKIFSILLTAIILFNASGLSMDIHYCLGEIEAFMFYGVADECDMSAGDQVVSGTLSHCTKLVVNEDHCCDDETFLVEGQSFPYEKATSVLPQLSFVTLYYLVNSSELSVDINLFSSFTQYLPPLIEHDIPVMIQSFLL